MRRRLLIPLCLMLFAGCETVVDVDLPSHDSRIVVNGFFGASQNWKVHLSRSQSSLSRGAPNLIGDARVEVREEGRLLGLLDDQRDGFYISDAFQALPGRAYTLRVSASGLPDVEAVSTVPDIIPTTAMRRLSPGTYGFHRPVEVTVRIEGSAEGSNYYRLAIERAGTHQQGHYRYRLSFKLLDRSIVESQTSIDLLEDQFTEVTFSDRRFAGRTYELKAIVEDYEWDDVETSVMLSVLSEEYYHYQRTVEMQQEAAQNPFAEPVQVYSNVRNGFGIFAAFNTHVVPLVPE